MRMRRLVMVLAIVVAPIVVAPIVVAPIVVACIGLGGTTSLLEKNAPNRCRRGSSGEHPPSVRRGILRAAMC